jgi:protein ImuB
MRIVCLHVPDFPLAAWLRVDPELRGAAAAVVEAPGARARVLAVSPEAARRGVCVGITAAQARAIAGDVVIRAASPDAEHAAQAALCDVAYSCSPRVEESGIGTVYCDADGLQALYASEAELARAIGARGRAVGLEVAVGIASTKIAAQLAARDGGGAIVPADEEWQFLAPLSITLLEPSPALGETFARWGIRTLGDLAALPASAVATRLGPDAARLARRARGEDTHPLAPRPLPLQFEESALLEYGVDALEPFLFVVRGLLDRLLGRLAVRGLICGDLRLSLGLLGRGRDERTVTVAAPTNALKPLLALIRVHLETHPPADAVESVRLSAVPERLRPLQLDLFRPNGPAPAQLAATLARLAAVCGAERLGTPVVVDSHRPDAHAVAPFALERGDPEVHHREHGGYGGSANRDAAPSVPSVVNPNEILPPLAVRAVRPPRPLEVFCDRDRPEFIRLADGDGTTVGCHGRVVTFAGPWRVGGEWWRRDAFHRDYYDAQLTDGVVYRVYFDRRRAQWFMDGIYD